MFTITHTSPNEITEIHSSELFGDVLFFSDDAYFMTAASNPVTYEMEIDEDLIENAGSLFNRDDCEKLDAVVAQLMSYADVDEEAAQDLLSEKVSAFDIGLDGEEAGDLSWYCQRLLGECATLLGEDAIRATDEQGTVYIVPMTGKLDRLKKV